MVTSQNGYTANDRSLIETITIPGTDRKVALRRGAPGQLLAHWAGWFDKHIESVDGGILDDWGYAERPIRGSTTTLSNHASGTALDINAPRHPLGKRNTFAPGQMAAIRKELKRYGGAIRWGGDYKNRADEMHFEINASVARCAEVLDKVREKPMNALEQYRAAVVQADRDFGCHIDVDRSAAQNMRAAIKAALEKGPKK